VQVPFESIADLGPVCGASAASGAARTKRTTAVTSLLKLIIDLLLATGLPNSICPELRYLTA
jgi:hypothetical protein